MPSTLRIDRDGRVMTVRFDHPPQNFMTREMVAELIELADSLEGDASIGAVVLTGATEGLFITHYDVEEILAGSETMDRAIGAGVADATLRAVGGLSRVPGGSVLVGRSPASGVAELRAIHDLFLRMGRMDKVFIAAINGPALGGGCEISLACDLRYMAAEAAGIGLPEMSLGFNPGAGGTQRLSHIVGPGRALEMMLEAKALEPQEALDVGLVHRVVPEADLLAEATATATRLSRRAPESVAGLKQAVLEGATRPLPQGLAIEQKWFLSTVSKPAARRAMRAYANQIAGSEVAPWSRPESLQPWRDGTAADLVSE
jgi:enoyl-CoA hydratase/carnithine racemase